MKLQRVAFCVLAFALCFVSGAGVWHLHGGRYVPAFQALMWVPFDLWFLRMLWQVW